MKARMSSRSERARNNVKAGVLVTLAIVLAFGVLVVLEDTASAFRPKSSYVVRFTISAGVGGLSVGSEVKVGGLRRGTVSAITLVAANGPATHIDVVIQLERDISIYPNAVAVLEVPLLGSGSWINFESVGDASAGPVLVEGSAIDASAGFGMLARLIPPAQIELVEEILANLDAIIASFRADYSSHVSPATAHLEQALGDAAQLVSAARHDYSTWRAQIGSTLASVDRASGRLDEVMGEAGGLLTDARDAVGAARAVIDDNRPSIDALVGNLEATSVELRVAAERINAELIERVETILATGQDGLDRFVALGDRLNAEVDLAGPRLQSALADAQLMAQQLRLASIEIRRSPWRLMYRPTNQELQHEMLYEAARSFALAAGDLRGTSESLDRVLDRHGAQIGADPVMAERLRLMLEQSLRRYERAQEVLFSILVDEKP